MGQFVGKVTSRGLWRRKGRMGRFLLTQQPAAPPFGLFSTDYSFAANEIGTIVINQRGIGIDTFYRSLDFSQSWQAQAAPNSGRHFQVAARPSSGTVNDNTFLHVGHRPGPGPTQTQRQFRTLSNRGDNSTVIYNEDLGNATSPIVSIAFTADGRYFYAQAQDFSGGGQGQGYVGTVQQLTVPIKSFQLPIAIGTGFNLTLAIFNQDADTQALFLIGAVDGKIYQIKLKHNIWTFKAITNPTARPVRQFAQRGSVIIGGTTGGGVANQIIRSDDYGETFAAHTVTGLNGDVHAVFLNGGKFFIGCNASNPLRESFNGINWTISSVQPPSGEAIWAATPCLDASFVFSGNPPGTKFITKLRQPGLI
jgi:hypothetical protein